MKNLYFVRHGLSQANIDRIWSGHFDTLLVDEGRLQAQEAGNSIINQEIKINLIIASPLIRTQETARIIAETIGYDPSQIITEQLLIERTFGVLEGKDSDEFFKGNQYADLDGVKGAETIKNLQERAQRLFDSIKARPEETILLVGHGAFGRAVRRVARGIPYTEEYSSDWEKNFIRNAELIKLI